MIKEIEKFDSLAIRCQEEEENETFNSSISIRYRAPGR